MKPHRYLKSLKKVWRRYKIAFLGGRRVLVLGDSHCGVFEYCFDRGLLVPHVLTCEIVAGATAYGLSNDSSVTQSWQKFDHALQRFANCDVVVIMLGECDCGFALWKKAEQLNVQAESLIEHSLAGVRRLFLKIRDDSTGRNKKIILVAPVLPTVDDLASSHQENILRREIKASHAERTHLVQLFNERLNQMAEALNIVYIDLSIQTLNSKTGLVDEYFVASAEDHHLSHPASAPIWASSLLTHL